MIVTLTANPSVDRTVQLAGSLERGRVLRALSVTDDPGGKGVNVARVVSAAGQVAVAVLPGQHDDPLLLALRDAGVTHRAVPVAGRARVNVTVAEPDGTTTKINEPGLPLDAPVRSALRDALLREAAGARWVALSGSLPPGVPSEWYADLVVALRQLGCAVAVDTSGPALAALLGRGRAAVPDLLKPNAEELAELTGRDADALENDPDQTADAARALVGQGVGVVLATLGAQGAVLVTAAGTWRAGSPRVVPRSTVGAGDSTLAGYLLADLAGAGPAQRLQTAVAYGAAAVALPGSAMPGPQHVFPDAVRVEALQPAAVSGRVPSAEPAAQPGR